MPLVTLIAIASIHKGAIHSAETNVTKSLQLIADKYRVLTKSSGVLIAVSDKRQVTTKISSGTRSSNSSEPLLPDDRVLIGSVSKSLTAGLIAIYVDKKSIRWNTTIGSAFPELTAEVAGGNSTATVEQILCHYSGLKLPFAPSVAGKSKNGPDFRYAILKAAFQEPAIARPGEKYAYNSSGSFSVAMLEKLTGGTYEKMMSDNFFVPLGLRTFSMGRPWKKSTDALVSEVQIDGKIQEAPANWQPQLNFDPSGAWSCSLPELLVLAKAQCYGGTFITGNSLDKLFTAPYGDNYCLGWSGSARSEWRGHSGSSGLGDSTVLRLAPRKQVAFAFSFKRGTGDPGIKELIGEMTKEIHAVVDRLL